MENIERPDADSARAALAEVSAAGTAVRDTPWPTWLYPVNAALFTLLGLTLLVEGPSGLPLTFAVSGVILFINWRAARRMGVLYALPTSRVFLIFVGISVACLVAMAVWGAAADTMSIWGGVVLAIVAGLSYLIGCVAHYRSTHRNQALGS